MGIPNETDVKETSTPVENSPELQSNDHTADPAATSAGTPDPKAATPGTQDPAAPPAPPAYTPNFKYKALDKEYEMPKWAQEAIKDAKTEEEARSIFAKAQGMEFYKGQREKSREEFRTFKEQAEPILEGVHKANYCLENNDLESFFKLWDVSDEIIFKYALDKIQYMQMDPAQKARFDQVRSNRGTDYDLRMQNQKLQQELEQVQLTTLDSQIQSILDQPEISVAASQFDARVNRPGAFKEELLRRGDEMCKQAKRFVPPHQVAQEMVKMYGLVPQPPQGIANPAASTPSPTRVVPNPEAKPVIPSVSGRSASVVKKRVESLDDLKKLGSEMGSQTE